MKTLQSGVMIGRSPLKGRAVFASQDYSKGNLIIVGKPTTVSSTRSMTSLQTNWNEHSELDEPACLTNHSCTPNMGVRNNDFGGYSFYALENIKSGAELTWDYNTTEYISISVPECQCNSANCRGSTPGFLYLEGELRSRYGGYIANYLKNPSNSANSIV